MSNNFIAFIGLGYIGLPTAVLLASREVSVVGIDISQHVVDSVNAGKLHIVEAGLAPMLQDVTARGFLRASTTVEPADVFVIAVPTPFCDNHKPDLSYIKAVSEAIAPVLKKGDLIILESTSPVGTTEQLEQWLAQMRPELSYPTQALEEADISIAYCPERVLPGNVLYELVNNDRIVGGLNKKSSQKAEAFYRLFVKGTITHSNARTAEMCKLTENSFRDVNIAFANELSIICHELDINVRELITLSNRHPRVNILQPGCGVGGHCIAVDPWFIVDKTPEHANIIRTAREINDYKPVWVVEKVKAKMADIVIKNPQKKISEIKVACLGLAFKPNIDDLRESPAVEITQMLAEIGCITYAVEPHIRELPKKLQLQNVTLQTVDAALEQADIICVLVKHDAFKEKKSVLSAMEYLVDTVGVL